MYVACWHQRVDTLHEVDEPPLTTEWTPIFNCLLGFNPHKGPCEAWNKNCFETGESLCLASHVVPPRVLSSDPVMIECIGATLIFRWNITPHRHGWSIKSPAWTPKTSKLTTQLQAPVRVWKRPGCKCKLISVHLYTILYFSYLLLCHAYSIQTYTCCPNIGCYRWIAAPKSWEWIASRLSRVPCHMLFFRMLKDYNIENLTKYPATIWDGGLFCCFVTIFHHGQVKEKGLELAESMAAKWMCAGPNRNVSNRSNANPPPD